MRRARLSALVAVAFALLAAGCGGTPDPTALTATPTPDANAAATTVATPLATGVTAPLTNPDPTPGANEIAEADAAVGKTVKISANTPKKFRDAHCSDTIMVVFYQPKAIVDEKLLQQATNAAASAGDVLMLVYTPKDVKAAGDLPAKLGLFATPGVATVGRDGKIENFWTTYVDQSLIKRSLLNAAAAKPCKVASGDVPTAGSALKDATVVASGGELDNASTNPLAGAATGASAVDATAAGTTVGDDVSMATT